jgi:hypothetical protein
MRKGYLVRPIPLHSNKTSGENKKTVAVGGNFPGARHFRPLLSAKPASAVLDSARVAGIVVVTDGRKWVEVGATLRQVQSAHKSQVGLGLRL